MAFATAITERARALGTIGMATLVSATITATAASGTSTRPPAGASRDLFAGTTAGPPRAIDRALDPETASTLVQVHCAVGDGSTRCWVSADRP